MTRIEDAAFGQNPFDAEGIANTCRKVIDNGRLTTWFLDLRSSRQLGLETTGHASRGTSSPPGPSATNLYIAAGDLSPVDLMQDIKSGFYVTELIGFGINGLTGDYSRGASGFWIENGEVTYPVSEMTIAGKFKGHVFNAHPCQRSCLPLWRRRTDSSCGRHDHRR